MRLKDCKIGTLVIVLTNTAIGEDDLAICLSEYLLRVGTIISNTASDPFKSPIKFGKHQGRRFVRVLPGGRNWGWGFHPEDLIEVKKKQNV